MRRIKAKGKEYNIKGKRLFNEIIYELSEDFKYHAEDKVIAEKVIWKDIIIMSNYPRRYKNMKYAERTLTVNQKNLIKEGKDIPEKIIIEQVNKRDNYEAMWGIQAELVDNSEEVIHE